MTGRKLRKGITTGSCAAAAAKAATLALFTGEILEKVEVTTPKNVELVIGTTLAEMESQFACFYVVKDSGDDPDVTNGIEIYCRAEKLKEPGVVLIGGKGVGTVTRPGLYVEVGQPAINPKPREMIVRSVQEVLPEGMGVRIIISIPKGEELAEKTYNPRLGIVGGISILGTSGIVEPMSEEAIKDTIYLELRAKRAGGAERAILVPGNYGETFLIREYGMQAEEIVKISNYVGFALKSCVELGYKEVLLAGHAGKLVKVAAGIWNTHSSISDTRMEVLTAYLALRGMTTIFLEKVMRSVTTEEAIKVIREAGEPYMEVFKTLADKAEERSMCYVQDELRVGIIIFSMKELLAVGENGISMVEEGIIV